MNDSRKRRRMLSLVVILAIALAVMWRWPADDEVTIGVEGRRTVEIAGPRLMAMPFTFGDPLAVRIAAVEPTTGGFRYDLRYMAYGPGEFDLRDYLLNESKQRPPALAKLPIRVESILPADHHGELFDAPPSTVDLQTRYRAWMGLAWGAWAMLLAPLIAYGRPHRRREPPPLPEPSVYERLRGLLELATKADLSIEQQADLEKLLLAYWARRLNLTKERLVDSLQQLRRHPAAATQVHRLERWLHSRTPDERGTVVRELLEQLAGEWTCPIETAGDRP